MSETNGTTSGTGAGALEFLDYAADKGQLNQNTAGALRAAVKEVLEVEGGDLSSIDVRSLDLDDLARRFANKRATDYTPKSLRTYQSRFRRAIDMYLRFLDNPATWRPEIKTRATASRDRTKREATSSLTPRVQPAAPLEPPRSSGLIQYPFPVRKDLVASLTLPADLTMSEAKRLSAFLQSLAVDELRALPSGKPVGEDKQI